jgi:hypothetical protein
MSAFELSPEAIAEAESKMASGSAAYEYGLHPDSGNGHRPLPAIIDSVDLVESDLPLPPLLIEGLLHKGSKMSLGGGSKTFKSWTFLSMAISVSTGHEWLGLDTERARVLIVNFEIADCWIRKRLDTLCCARKLRPERGWLDFWNLRGYSAPHAIIIPQIIERAKSLGYGLVIIDPSYKLIGQGDENSASDVGAMMTSFELIAVETQAAVLFGAHFAKGNAAAKEAIDRISGSGVFARDPDTILTFTHHEAPNCFTVEATLRNLPPINSFVVEWTHPYFQRKPDLDPADLKKRPGRPKTYSDTDVLDLLKPASLTSGNWQKRAFSELGVSRGVFFDILKRLSGNGLALKSKINDCWTIVSKQES